MNRCKKPTLVLLSQKIGCEVIPDGVLDIEKNWIAESEARYEAYKRGSLRRVITFFYALLCI